MVGDWAVIPISIDLENIIHPSIAISSLMGILYKPNFWRGYTVVLFPHPPSKQWFPACKCRKHGLIIFNVICI
jgi:hypothetical protein